jgi:hypothetical protein
MRGPKIEARSVVVFSDEGGPRGAYTRRMIQKIDSAKGRFMYSRRIGIVEPVFAHIQHALGLHYFSLRSKVKVDIQWKLFAMVHNISKLFMYSPRFAF